MVDGARRVDVLVTVGDVVILNSAVYHSVGQAAGRNCAERVTVETSVLCSDEAILSPDAHEKSLDGGGCSGHATSLLFLA